MLREPPRLKREGGPKPPALPVVGTVTGFAHVSTRAYRDLACTPSDCYGASGTLIEKIANGATAPSATPALPFTGTYGIANVAPRARSSTR